MPGRPRGSKEVLAPGVKSNAGGARKNAGRKKQAAQIQTGRSSISYHFTRASSSSDNSESSSANLTVTPAAAVESSAVNSESSTTDLKIAQAARSMMVDNPPRTELALDIAPAASVRIRPVISSTEPAQSLNERASSSKSSADADKYAKAPSWEEFYDWIHYAVEQSESDSENEEEKDLKGRDLEYVKALRCTLTTEIQAHRKHGYGSATPLLNKILQSENQMWIYPPNAVKLHLASAGPLKVPTEAAMKEVLNAYLSLKVLVWLPDLLHRDEFEEEELKLCCPRCGGRNTKIREIQKSHPARLVCTRCSILLYSIFFLYLISVRV